MAKLRQLGNIAQMMLQNHLMAKRQQEMADYEGKIRRGVNEQEAGLQRDTGLLDDLRGNPDMLDAFVQNTGGRVGGVDVSALGRTLEQRLAPIAKTIAETSDPSKRFTDEDIKGLARGAGVDPMQYGMNYRPSQSGEIPSSVWENHDRPEIGQLLAQRDAKLGMLRNEQAFQDDRAAANEYAKSFSNQTGQNQATQDFAPAKRQIAVDDQNALTPGLVDRERQLGRQRTNERLGLEQQLTPILTGRERDMVINRGLAQQELDRTNPIYDAIAEKVIADPTLLKDLTPTDRAKVLARANTGEMQSAARKSSIRMITAARQALTELQNTPGKAGAVGAGWQKVVPFLDGFIPGSPEAAYQSKADALQAALALPYLDFMRGLGHMSELEFGTLKNVATKGLNTQIPEQVWDKTLKEIDDALRMAEAQNGIQSPPRVSEVVDKALQKLNQRRGRGR